MAVDLLHALTLGDILRENRRSHPQRTAEIGDTVRAGRELAQTSAGARWIQHDGGEYEAFLERGATDDPLLVVDPSLPVLQLYTAAFTGRPNGALLSHWAVLVQDLVMGN